jgi:CheY-like chemotaxis protein
LVVEDGPMVRNLVQMMLSKEGYAVLAAKDGQEALEICRQFKDQIHLLLTDVIMPRNERFGSCGTGSTEKTRNYCNDDVGRDRRHDMKREHA